MRRRAVRDGTREIGMTNNTIITVASGKGGVGKTWFSVTLAQTLAAAGRNVLLFDGDLGLANVDVQLGLEPGHDLGSVIAGRVALNDAITSYQPKVAGGASGNVKFDILAGKSGSGALSGLSQVKLEGLRQGIVALSKKYDIVVADLAAGLDVSVMTLSDTGGICLVVVTDEPTSLTDAYAFIKLLSMHDPQADIRVLVNMAASKEHAQRTYTALATACRNFLDLSPPFAGFVPRDDLVRDAIRHQTPIALRHPRSSAAEAVKLVARRLLEAPKGTHSGAPVAEPAAGA